MVSESVIKSTATHIKKLRNQQLCFPVDIDRRAAHYEQFVNKTCNYIVDYLFIVGNTTFLSISTDVVDFTPVHILYRGQR